MQAVAGRARSPDDLAWLVALAAAAIAVVWFRVEHLQEASALYGFSPSSLLDPVWYRPEFARDFPSGEAETLKSLVGQTYRAFGLLRLPAPLAVAFMILAEFGTLAAGAYLAARSVNPELPRWTAIAAALFLTTSALVNADLARWHHPFYGSAYNFAHGAGLIAFSCILSGKPVRAGVAIGIAGTIHPTMALFYGIAMGVAALVTLRSLRILRLLTAFCVAALIAGGWTYLMISGADMAPDQSTRAMFIELARMMSYHWFPFTLGIFDSIAYERVLPLLAILLVFAALMGGGDKAQRSLDRQIFLAVIALICLAFAGTFISEFSGSPLLVKLALHRASGIALVLCALVLVPRLAYAATAERALIAAGAMALLLMPFWRNNGLPFWLCLGFAVVLAISGNRKAGGRDRMLATGLVGVLALVTLAAVAVRGGWLSITNEPSIGLAPFRSPYFLGALAVCGIAWMLRRPAVLAVVFGVCAVIWAPVVRAIDENALEKARRYLEVQSWAREATAPDALFMVDPAIAYGWREHAQRPSFGTVREWLYAGWIYDTKADVIEEGVRRAESVGIDVQDFLERDRRKHGAGKNELTAVASQFYHDQRTPWFSSMAQEYGIDYFVLDKTGIARPLPELAEIAYENERFLVLRAPASD